MFAKWRDARRISLALQGGGAHGAFTWGVLDALLEDGRLDFDGVSGTSAGAMNAVMLAQGLAAGGRDGAREALADFWQAVARSLPFEVAGATADGDGVALAPAMKLFLRWTRHFSPYQLNPFGINPLRGIVGERVDFERLRRACPVRLFLATTRANSGKLRLVREAEVSLEAVLASACLPTLHHAVELDGEPHWDGGYSANPAVFPLIYDCRASDILLVLLSPLDYRETPRSAAEIHERALDIAFNANFLREMRMIAHAREYISGGWLKLGRLERRLARLHFHLVEAEDEIGTLPGESRLAAWRPFLERLRDLGRARAQEWLARHHGAIGRRSTMDLAGLFS